MKLFPHIKAQSSELIILLCALQFLLFVFQFAFLTQSLDWLQVDTFFDNI
jgi:hypothetical protein